jgi:hypothetical protein
MSCASADDVGTSIACAVTVTDFRELDHRQADVQGDHALAGRREVDRLFSVTLEKDLDLVLSGRHLQRVAAVHVGVDDLAGADHFHGHAGQGDGVGFVADDTGDAHRLHPPYFGRRRRNLGAVLRQNGRAAHADCAD